jgi:hypothetical protein
MKPNRRAGGTPARYLAERYLPGITLERAIRDARRLGDAARRMTAQGRPVRYLGSTLLPAEETVFDLIETEDEHNVAELARRGGAGFDRVSSAVSIPAQPRPEAPARRPAPR